MDKAVTLEAIRSSRIVAIIRENDPDIALNAAMACYESGITCIEVALTTPRGLHVIERLAKVANLTVGAGTVLDAQTAASAIHAGATFLLSPAVVPEMIRACSKYGVVSVPGAFTATETLSALEAGADIVKIFPAKTGGPDYIASLAAPFPQAVFMPSGGVSSENLDRWFVRGVIAVGVGGYLTADAASGDYAAVREKARRLVAAAQTLKTGSPR
ncbi:bifunctional 4-hydroxy-2-oxoglutarate aldolase/2-dehydro-3-deoxy-phosphogluconate aldolase [Burkholderia sp. JPY481]